MVVAADREERKIMTQRVMAEAKQWLGRNRGRGDSEGEKTKTKWEQKNGA